MARLSLINGEGKADDHVGGGVVGEAAGAAGHAVGAGRDEGADRLHADDRAWIASSPFLLLATSGSDGTCDVSPKGDPAGFTLILDDTTLAIPDRPGNRRVDGFRNVLATRTSARSSWCRAGTRRCASTGGRGWSATRRSSTGWSSRATAPALALLVGIEQVFFHCAKAFKRSGLWRPEGWADPAALPSNARIVKDTMDIPETLAELEEYYGPEYDKRLY